MNTHNRQPGEDQDFVVIGTIGRAVGLEGECIVFPTGKTLTDARVPYRCFIGHGTPERETKIVTTAHRSDGSLKVRFEGVDTRDGAELFTNNAVFVEIEKLPPTGDNEFYHFELIGMEVCGERTGATYGTVKEVLNLPSVDSLEIEKKEGHRFIIPMTQEVIVAIKKEKRQILVSDAMIEELAQ